MLPAKSILEDGLSGEHPILCRWQARGSIRGKASMWDIVDAASKTAIPEGLSCPRGMDDDLTARGFCQGAGRIIKPCCFVIDIMIQDGMEGNQGPPFRELPHKTAPYVKMWEDPKFVLDDNQIRIKFTKLINQLSKIIVKAVPTSFDISRIGSGQLMGAGAFGKNLKIGDKRSHSIAKVFCIGCNAAVNPINRYDGDINRGAIFGYDLIIADDVVFK